MSVGNALYATDEYGRPFIIVKEQQKKSRLSGIEAIKVSFLKKNHGVMFKKIFI